MRVSIHSIRPPQVKADEIMLARAVEMAYNFARTGFLPPVIVETRGHYEIIGDPVPYLVAHITGQATVSITDGSSINQGQQSKTFGSVPGPVVQLPGIDLPKLGEGIST